MTGSARRGDADISHTAALFAEPARARVLVALADGRALPASVLASEAGVSPQAVSAHLARLRDAGLVAARKSGRHRYYSLTSPHVAAVLEALAVIAPERPVRSLREGTRAEALRRARTCYDHLAGRLGVAVTEALLAERALVPVEGAAVAEPRLSAPVAGPPPYRLGERAATVFARLGVPPERLDATGSRRPLLRFCTDWSEQLPHLAGRLGADLLAAVEAEGWIVRRPGDRAVRLTEPGARELRARLGVTEPGPRSSGAPAR